MNIDLVQTLAPKVISLVDTTTSFNPLYTAIADAQIVLLGEATHGTHEFYTTRAELSKYLIQEKGFNAIAVEADWPDAYALHLYIHNQTYTRAHDAFALFDHFPTWMWANVTMVDFIEWLKSYNQTQEVQKQIGFHGLDLYSLYRSIDVIVQELKKIDPAAAHEAQQYYSCFEQYRHDPQAYGYAVLSGKIESCKDAVMAQFKKMQDEAWSYLATNKISADEALNLEQNAFVIKNAEEYYRQLFFNEVSNWNLRDSHMFHTLGTLIQHYQLRGIKHPKIIVWAHNSHIGNAAATQMSEYGEYNIGQLVKEHYKDKAYTVGFTTYTGTVSAASGWHSPVERKQIRPALKESYEALFHAVDIPNFLLLLNDAPMLAKERLERAIGVVYHPQTERASHYFFANITQQFDAVIHYDTTHALEPLAKTARWLEGELPESYPSGL